VRILREGGGDDGYDEEPLHKPGALAGSQRVASRVPRMRDVTPNC